MTLRQKQSLFASLIAEHILYIESCGYQVTLGDAARMDCRGHMKNSCHYIRLAVDLNLFKDGKYLTTTEAHKPFGVRWEKQHRFCRWGGNIKKGIVDGNHYSLFHNGRW